MILRQLINIAFGSMANASMGTVYNTTGGAAEGELPNTFSMATCSMSTYDNASTGGSINIAKMGIILAGDTQEALPMNKYNLENPLNDALTSLSNTLTPWNFNPDGTMNPLVCTQTVRNDGEQPVTVNSVCLFGASSNNPSKCTLWSYTILDTPVVINPNEVKTFTVELDLQRFLDNTYNT